MNKNYIVTKSNNLINCNYVLSLQEQKIILTLASMVQPQDTEFKEYKFKIKEFIELLGVDTQTKYTEVPKITKELMKKVFEIREGKRIIQLAWLSSAIYETGEGTVTLKFDSNLKPYMLELKELYTSYKLENILSLKSKYSIRLYEILKSNLFKKHVTIELEELKKMMSATEKTYNTYGNLKSKILIQVQEELKQKTDISFAFEEIKTGRKVTSIKFIIHSDKTNSKDEIAATTDATLEDPQQDKYKLFKQVQQVKEIFEEAISDKEALSLLSTARENINIIRDKYAIAKQQGNIKNVVGFVIKAIKEDYKEPVGKDTANSFRDYSGQREIDIKQLEKEFLGRD